MREAIRIPGLRRMVVVGLAVLVVLGAVSAPSLTHAARANGVQERASIMPGDEVRSEQEELTELTVEGIGSRSVNYDGAIGRFTVSVLRDSLITAVSDGNATVQAIADEVAEKCTEGEPDADHTTDPTCISPSGLQTVGIRIQEEFDWTEQGRVSQGFRYENRLSIAIRGTGFAGGLVDMVITSGGDNVRFEGLDFTVSRRAEFERLALLDAIDDARATAQAIADHMGYEIVRIVRMTPGTPFDPYGESERFAAAELALDDSGSGPTPVFGGAETVTSRVTMVFEIRPPAQVEEESSAETDK